MPRQLIVSIVIGSLFIAEGLIPGRLAEDIAVIEELMHKFRNPFTSHPRRKTHERERIPGQAWLAVGGAVLIAVNMLYFSS